VELDGVVMAAGEGSRLRPLTERWPKPVLPIDGRPVVGTLLRELVATGLERVTVVVGHLGEQVRALLGDGSAYGLEVRYAEQPEAHGSADAVRRAIDSGAAAPLLVAAADTVFQPGDVAEAAARWLRSETAGGLAVRRVPHPELEVSPPVHVEDGLVVELAGDRAQGALAAAPLWFLGEALAARLEGLSGPPYELAEAFRAALAAGDPVAALPVGRTRDLTRPVDVVARNFPYLG
jgi:NDP-sugar pyrophosphorylase family protein